MWSGLEETMVQGYEAVRDLAREKVSSLCSHGRRQWPNGAMDCACRLLFPLRCVPRCRQADLPSNALVVSPGTSEEWLWACTIGQYSTQQYCVPYCVGEKGS